MQSRPGSPLVCICRLAAGLRTYRECRVYDCTSCRPRSPRMPSEPSGACPTSPRRLQRHRWSRETSLDVNAPWRSACFVGAVGSAVQSLLGSVSAAEDVRPHRIHLGLPHRFGVRLLGQLVEGEADGALHGRTGLLRGEPLFAALARPSTGSRSPRGAASWFVCSRLQVAAIHICGPSTSRDCHKGNGLNHRCMSKRT
jgi:hypothetical protein